MNQASAPLPTGPPFERLFARFNDALRDTGYFAMGEQIFDATVVEARRLTQGEKATVWRGLEDWSKARRA